MANRTTQTEPTFRVVPSADKMWKHSILFGEHMLPTVPQDHLACPLEAPGENWFLTTAGTMLILKYVQGHPGKPLPRCKPHPQTLMEPWSPGLM